MTIKYSKPDKIKLKDAVCDNPIMLIDGSPLLYINGNKPNYKECIDSFMSEFSGICGSDRYIGVIDNGKSFRTKIVSTYKASRPSKESLLEKYPFLHRVKDYLVNTYKFNLINNIEGDDAIAIMNRRLNPCYSVIPIDANGKDLLDSDGNPIEHYRTRYNTVMISIDKDFLQLAGVHLNIKNRSSHVVYPSRASIDVIDGKIYATSYKLLYAQTMMGDSADNIKGLPKYGQVKATKVLQDVNSAKEAYDKCLQEYSKVYCGQDDDPIKELDTTLRLVTLLSHDQSFIDLDVQTIPIVEHHNVSDDYNTTGSIGNINDTRDTYNQAIPTSSYSVDANGEMINSTYTYDNLDDET